MLELKHVIMLGIPALLFISLPVEQIISRLFSLITRRR